MNIGSNVITTNDQSPVGTKYHFPFDGVYISSLWDFGDIDVLCFYRYSVPMGLDGVCYFETLKHVQNDELGLSEIPHFVRNDRLA